MNQTTLTFPFPLHPAETKNFRAAIVEQLGLGHQLFHGHDNSTPGETRYTNEYPLVRFCTHRGRAQIIGMGEGADAIIRHLLPVIPSTLVFAGRPHDTAGWKLKTGQWEPEVLPEYQSFGLYQWVALNSENYAEWKKYDGKESARRLILDRCLTGQLRALAEAAGLDWPQRSRIVARVLRQDNVKKLNWHGTQLIGFNVVAEANFLPPYGLGVGRCHSFGFGEVCSERAYAALAGRKRKPAKNDADDGLELVM